MRHGRVIAVTAGLCVVAAALGLAAGRHALPSESAVIEAAAGAYVAETGGAPGDCIGLPGLGDVWVVVQCGPAEQRHSYRFDRRGALIGRNEEPPA